jgi:hypothetical protein
LLPVLHVFALQQVRCEWFNLKLRVVLGSADLQSAAVPVTAALLNRSVWETNSDKVQGRLLSCCQNSIASAAAHASATDVHSYCGLASTCSVVVQVPAVISGAVHHSGSKQSLIGMQLREDVMSSYDTRKAPPQPTSSYLS